MNTLKFSINEIWESRDGSIYLITDISAQGNFPVIAQSILPMYDDDNLFYETFTKDGFSVSINIESNWDLIKCLGPRENHPQYFL